MTNNLNTAHHQNWATPTDFFLCMDRIWDFTIDVCADETNHKCERYFTAKQDGLAQSWAMERAYCNPPYSNPEPWLEKGYQHAKDGNGIAVFLLPASTDVGWFHKLAVLGEIWFLCGRLKFEAPPQYEGKDPGPATGQMLVVYTPPILSADFRCVRLVDRKLRELGKPLMVQRSLF